MSINRLYHKLAVERCRLYLAQLTAVNHFEGHPDESAQAYHEQMGCIIRHMNCDLDLIDHAVEKFQQRK